MPFIVTDDGWIEIAGRVAPCVLGRGGVKPASHKIEGDGATPLGAWPIRGVLYRADRVARPETRLPVEAIRETDGWCDSPDDAAYNCPVTLPYDASHERMWRDDHVYDLVAVLGHNDDPVIAGAGSAIFLHLEQPDRRPTEGCVAISRDDFLALVSAARPGDVLEVRRAG